MVPNWMSGLGLILDTGAFIDRPEVRGSKESTEC